MEHSCLCVALHQMEATTYKEVQVSHQKTQVFLWDTWSSSYVIASIYCLTVKVFSLSFSIPHFHVFVYGSLCWGFFVVGTDFAWWTVYLVSYSFTPTLVLKVSVILLIIQPTEIYCHNAPQLLLPLLLPGMGMWLPPTWKYYGLVSNHHQQSW